MSVKFKNQSFSIVVPVFNEGQNIMLLYNEINESLKNYSYEIIFVNDASTDDSNYYFEKIKIDDKVKIINKEFNSGQSSCLLTGIKKAKNNIIVTLDGDCQNDPHDIVKLLEIYHTKISANFHLIGGIRKVRKDNVIKIISSFLANKIRSFILKDNCEDTGCGLKVFTKNIFLRIPYFNSMHRFLPALFQGLGCKTFFVNVNHRNRIYGHSKYGTVKRLFFGVIDIFKVLRIIKYLKSKI